MATEPRWTLETYRLDEIARKFDLPCVVCVTEGFYSATEAEGFSQGDIISIDSRMILHKVAANFAKDIDFEFEQKNHDSYVDLRKENEILVPLNYKGKLRVLKRSQNFDSVRELAVDFPRYAKLRQNLTVEGEGKPKITITAGTVIELDRILPGGAGSDKGKLVVQFMHMGKPTIVALPLGLRGKFQTEPDRNEYTVKEAIDRYSLPQTIRFVDDEIKRVYTQDLVDGIENMTTITETLRLNRLVTQEVLVGHFKPAEGTEDTDTERFRQRTLVVLPIDNPDIRDIEVNVLLNVTEDFYSDVFLVRNVSRTEEIVDGSLYIDFVTSPGIKRITDVREDPESTQSTHKPYPPSTVESPPTSAFSDEAAPPIPPRQHGQYQNRRQSKSTEKTAVTRSVPVADDSDGDEYEPVSSPTAEHAVGLEFTLAGISFDDTGKKHGKEKKKGVPAIIGTFFHKRKVAKINPGKKDEQADAIQPSNPVGAGEMRTSQIYDEVDELKMNKLPGEYDVPSHPRPIEISGKTGKKPSNIPVARVSPSTNQKHFFDLTMNELVERLTDANLTSAANMCQKDNLNGSFFKNMSKDEIQGIFELTKLELIKFMKMKDENWVPTF